MSHNVVLCRGCLMCKISALKNCLPNDQILHLQKNRMNIFVAGLPYDFDDAELREFFEKFGLVKSAKVAMDKATGKSRGFAFVEMPNEEEAKEAIEGLNGISLGRKALVVKQADDRPPSGGGGGGFKRDQRGGFDRRPPRRY